MNIELVKSETRGTADHGWLKSNFSFSFAEYYNPEKMGFGMLRVLNDDIIAPGKGFGFHPHNNMEIISVPITGMLEHRDSMNNASVIEPGDIQVMSAGSGIVHSEINPSATEAGNFLQIWILPKERNIKPRYQQISFEPAEYKDNLLTIVAPIGEQQALSINQDAYLVMGKYSKDKEDVYTLQKKGNGVFLFVIEGEAIVSNVTARKRDALQITDCSSFDLSVTAGTHILIIEVPIK